MATPVIMPRQGQSVESCIIAKWYKKKGDRVKVGDMLLTYETDKATFDEEAKEDGIILDIFFEEGDDVPVLTNICVIGQEGEDTSQFDPRKQNDQEAVQEVAQEVGQEVGRQEKADEKATVDQVIATDGTFKTAEEGKIKISPRARNLAEKTGINYRYAEPTGPYGRIIERDIISLREKGPVFTLSAKDESSKTGGVIPVEGTGLGGRITTDDLRLKMQAGVQTGEPTAVGKTIPTSASQIISGKLPGVDSDEPEFTEVKLTNIRKVIAKSMHHSLSTTAQLTLNTTFNATEILEDRKKLKENKDKLGIQNITINDIILFAVSRTLLNHKSLNAHFLDDRMLVFNSVHMGVAIDTERGLMVPTVFYANYKTLNEISAEVKKLAEDCQKGTINPDLLQGGTFTVTNLGMLDIESFTPVLNPPQTGILGVNNIVQRVKEVNGQHVYYPAMGLSLTFDHRAVDGAPAAKFLKDLKVNLENFSVLLAK